MGKFLKNWGALTVAIIAVVTSVCALYLDYEHSERALKSLQDSDARHDEQFAAAMNIAEEANELAGEANDAAEKHYQELKLSDSFLRLLTRLNDQREWLNEIPDNARAAGLPFHNEAKSNYREAEKELSAGNFDRVRELNKIAMISLEKCYIVAKEVANGELPPEPVWIPQEPEVK